MNFAEKSASVFKRDIFLKIWTFLTGVIIARILGPANVGVWYILLMIPSYAEPFGRLKFDIASVYFLGKDKYKFGEVYFNLIAVTLFSAVAIIALFFWQRNFIFVNLLKNSLNERFLVYLMLLYVPFSFMNTAYSYLLLAKEDVRGYNSLCIIPPVISTSLGIILLILRMGLVALVATTLLGGFIGVFYGAYRIAKTERLICRLNIRMLRDFLNFAAKLYASGLISHFQLYVSGVLVAMYLIPSAVTFYRMGQQNALMFCMVTSALGTFLYPLVAKESGLRANEVTARICRLSFLMLSVLAVISAVIIRPAVYLLYGKAFLPQVSPFLILLPGVIFYGSANVLTSYFLGRGKPGIVLKLSLIPLVVQLALCLLLIPRLNIAGAAISTSLSYLLAGAFNIIIFASLAKIRLKDAVLPNKSDITILLSHLKKFFLQNNIITHLFFKPVL